MTTQDFTELNDTLRSKLNDQAKAQESIRTIDRDIIRPNTDLMASIQATLQSAIATELHPDTNKPVYSNAEARSAELMIRTDADPAYQHCDKLLGEAREEIARISHQQALRHAAITYLRNDIAYALATSDERLAERLNAVCSEIETKTHNAAKAAVIEVMLDQLTKQIESIKPTYIDES